MHIDMGRIRQHKKLVVVVIILLVLGIGGYFYLNWLFLLGVGSNYPALKREAAETPSKTIASYSCGNGYEWRLVNKALLIPGNMIETGTPTELMPNTNVLYLYKGNTEETGFYFYVGPDPANGAKPPFLRIIQDSTKDGTNDLTPENLSCLQSAGKMTPGIQAFYDAWMNR